LWGKEGTKKASFGVNLQNKKKGTMGKKKVTKSSKKKTKSRQLQYYLPKRTLQSSKKKIVTGKGNKDRKKKWKGGKKTLLQDPDWGFLIITQNPKIPTDQKKKAMDKKKKNNKTTSPKL